jgi:hypothetical protein
MIQIRFKDVDPDTGETTQDKLIATCETESMSNWVLYALKLAEKEDSDPNREIYTIYSSNLPSKN